MLEKLIESTFRTKFKLENLKKLINKIYQQAFKIKDINPTLETINSMKRIKLHNSQQIILVLELKEKLGWDFKLRKLVANYLKKEQVKFAKIIVYTAEYKQWYWSIVKRNKLSPYLLNSYTVLAGQNLNQFNIAKIKASLVEDDLNEVITDFKSDLRSDFITKVKYSYNLMVQDLEGIIDLEQKNDLELPELAQKIIIKTVILFLLEQKGLLTVRVKEKSSLTESLVDLAQLDILEVLANKNNSGQYSLIDYGLLKQFWFDLKEYDWITVEGQPWEEILSLSPAILAKLNEELLPSNQRKSTGVFYTPPEIVQYMSQQTIIDFLVTKVGDLNYKQVEMLVKEKNLKDQNRQLLPQIYNCLSEIKVCDPAVGSGAFALGMAKELLRIKKLLLDLIGDDCCLSELKDAIVRDSIYCMDIDQAALAITKFRLWLWTEKNKNQTLANLEFNIVRANPLLKIERNLEQQDQELKAIRKQYLNTNNLIRSYQNIIKFSNLKKDKLGLTFSFVDYFPEVFKEGGFDIVIGNPPYIGEKGNKEIFREIRKYALRDFYSGKMDIFYFFFHIALDILKQKGTMALLTTDYYLTATGAYKLRTDLQQRGVIKHLIDFSNLRLFPAAIGQHNLITILQKESDDSQSDLAQTTVTYREGDADKQTLLSILAKQDQKSNYYSIPQKSLYQGEKNYLRLELGQVDELLAKVKLQGQNLGEICEIHQGIVSGCDRISPRHIRNYNLAPELKGTGIFVLDEEEVEELNLSKENQKILRPWFKNSDIKQYWCCSENKGKYLLYLDQQLKELPQKIKEYFKPFKEILEDRREVQAGRLLWWQLQWSRQEEIFLGPKLVVPQRSKKNTFAYNEQPWYASADVYYITDPKELVDLKYILALLNSKLYYLWLYYKGKKKGKLLELYQRPLTRTPIKIANEQQQQILVDLVNSLEAKKEKLFNYQSIDFWEVKNKLQFSGDSKLQEIIDENCDYQLHYQGQANIVRNLKVEINSDLITVYSAKSSSGYYKLFEFRLSDQQLRLYLKFYLENLTEDQIAVINQSDISSVVDRVLQIVISGYQDDDKILILLDKWQQIKERIINLKTEINDLEEEINYLVYKLYQFTEDEIDFLNQKVAEINNY